MAIINVLELILFILLIVLIKLIMELSQLKKEIENSACKLDTLFKQKNQANGTPDFSENAITQKINEYNSFVLKYRKLQKFLPNFILIHLKHTPVNLWPHNNNVDDKTKNASDND